MIPLERPAPVPATVVVTVPHVATTVSDGLPGHLRAGGVRVVLPVWQAPDEPPTTARLAVGPTACAPVTLSPGGVVRVVCATSVRPGTTVVRLLADGTVVASWRHRVG